MLIAWLRMIILEVLSKSVVKNMDWEASEEAAHVVLIKTTIFFPYILILPLFTNTVYFWAQGCTHIHTHRGSVILMR